MKQFVVFAVAALFFAAGPFGQAAASPAGDKSAKEQREVAEAFNGFLHVWLIEQDIDKAIGFFEQDESFISGTRRMFELTDSEALNTDEWLRKTLVMWLFKDHGEVNALGHGDPRSAEYAQLPTDPKNIVERIQPKMLADAAKEVRIHLSEDDQGAAVYAAMALLGHVSREPIFFIFKKVGKQWKINGLIWVAG
ncbi:MAG: hypothetical protein Q7S09_03955 [bacterium]|nr:hypothetical protein [bacterium]